MARCCGSNGNSKDERRCGGNAGSGIVAICIVFLSGPPSAQIQILIMLKNQSCSIKAKLVPRHLKNIRGGGTGPLTLPPGLSGFGT